MTMHVPPVKDSHVQTLRVLLVEDSKLLAERMVESIRQVAAVNVIGVTDTEAIATAVVGKGDVDVMILDLQLKQGTGFGVLKSLAALARMPHVIVVTNYDLPEYQKAVSAYGAVHFLDKAKDLGRLPDLLRTIQAAQKKPTDRS